MGALIRRYGKDESAKRAETFFAAAIVSQLGRHKPMDFLAIDVETGIFAVGADPLKACRLLRKRVPDAQVWLRRVGSRHLCHFGGHGLGGKP